MLSYFDNFMLFYVTGEAAGERGVAVAEGAHARDPARLLPRARHVPRWGVLLLQVRRRVVW